MFLDTSVMATERYQLTQVFSLRWFLEGKLSGNVVENHGTRVNTCEQTVFAHVSERIDTVMHDIRTRIQVSPLFHNRESKQLDLFYVVGEFLYLSK